MNDPAPSMSKGKKLFIIIGSFLCISLGCVYLIWNWIAQKELRQAIERIESLGYPQNVGDILPPLPAIDDDAYPFYKQASEALELADWSTIEMEIDTHGRDPLVEASVKVFEEFLKNKDAQNAHKLLVEASTKSGCDFNLDYNDGMHIMLPYFEWGNLLYLNDKINYHIYKKEFTAAQTDMIIALKYLQFLRREPILVNQSSAIFSEKNVHDAMKTIGATGESIKPELLNLLDTNFIKQSFINSLHGERILFADAIFKAENSGEILAMMSGTDLGILMSMYKMSPLWHFDHASLLNTMTETTLIAEKPYSLTSTIPEPDSWHLFTNQVISYYNRINTSHLNHIAQIEIIKTGIAIFSYKRQHNAYPDSIDKLRYIGIDPFNGKPLIFTKTSDGFILKSVGENLSGTGIDLPKWEYKKKP